MAPLLNVQKPLTYPPQSRAMYACQPATTLVSQPSGTRRSFFDILKTSCPYNPHAINAQKLFLVIYITYYPSLALKVKYTLLQQIRFRQLILFVDYVSPYPNWCSKLLLFRKLIVAAINDFWMFHIKTETHIK